MGEVGVEEKAEESKMEERVEEEIDLPKEMKAVILTGFGGLKTIKTMRKPLPTVGKGEVLIRVKACGLNFQDILVRQGLIDNPPKIPFILGFECAGEVEGIGEKVMDIKVGDKVAAFTEYKSWAELTAVPSKYVYRLPEGMSFLDAAAMLMNYVVAYIVVFDMGNIHSNQSVLVHSAGGGVGQAISQLLQSIYKLKLIGIASKHKHDSIKNSFTHLLDHDVDYVQETRKLCPKGVDVVLDCSYGDDSKKGYNLLKPLGRYILYGTSSFVTGETKSLFSFTKSWWQADKLNFLKLYEENRSVLGFNLHHLLYQQGAHEYICGVVNKIFKLWEERQIKPVIDSIWAFEDVPEAMQKLHNRKNIGKITLDPSMHPKPKIQAKGGKGKDKEKEDDQDPGEGTSGEAPDSKTGEEASASAN